MLKIISISLFILTLAAAIFIGFAVVENSMENGEADFREYYLENYKVKIEIEADEHCAITSQNPIWIENGQNATFDVMFDENYQFNGAKTSEGVKYKNGVLTIEGCAKNATFNLASSKIHEYYSFDAVNAAPETGSVTLSHSSGVYVENTEITAKAIPKGDQVFIGWSNDKPVLEGGSVCSYSATYTFKLSENMKLYPNFLTEGYSIIKYNLNGGYLASDKDTDVIITQFSKANRLCANLIPDDGTIVRDGYTLIEYTANQDGTGEVYNPGGVAKIDDGTVFEVYAQWSEWTPAEDFDYKTDSATGEITITQYRKNTEGTVSIPAKINGVPVTKIAKDAFRRKSFSTLVIPSSVKTIENSAFYACSKFDTLYITDSFTSIYDSAFDQCKKFSNLRLNAALKPHHVGHAENLAPRLDVILNRDTDKPLMLFVGGSSCLYGIKANYAEESLDYKYQTLNCGTNAGGTGILYMEAFSKLMKEGDIIINVPEYGANQMGGTEIVLRTIRATESCYNIYRYVDFSKYIGLFTAITEYNTDTGAGRKSGTASTYDKKNTSLTARYCDLNSIKLSGNNNYADKKVNAGSLKASAVTAINNLYSSLAQRGIKFYFSCAPICYSAPEKAYQDSNLIAYYNKTLSELKCPVISHPANYTFKSICFNNSDYHLDTENALIRTERAVADIKAQFNKEAQQ